MNVEQILKMGGFPNTKKGIEAFYKAYPTKDSFMKKFGGVAFPQAPSADEFFSNTFAPNTPRGFYAEGGMTNEIAFPMQPPADYFFSAYPFTPEYQGGGTVSELWQEVTGTPWSEAKKQGLTDGSYDANMALFKRLQAGEFNKGTSAPKVFRDPPRHDGPTQKQTKYEQRKKATSEKPAAAKKRVAPKEYYSEAEYRAHLLDPYSPEKRQAEINWLTKKGKEKAASSKQTPLNLQSGMITDRNKNVMYVIKNGKVVKQFNVGTGANRDIDVSDIPILSVDEMDKLSNKEAKKYKVTPRGAYLAKPEGPEHLYGKPGFGMYPINYANFPDKNTLPKNLAIHLLYGIGPKGTEGYDPVEGARRMKLMKGPGEQRNFSYGCTNMYGQDIDCLTGELFPQGDTTFVVDTRLPQDVAALRKFGIKKYGGLPGGANEMPCFECGGYMQDGGEEEGGAVSAFNYGQFPAIMGDGGEDMYAKGGWIKKVSKSMEKRGTKGSFTKYCGGKVTDECIERGLNSPNPLTRKRAGLAKAFRSMAKKQEGGDVGYGLDPNDIGKERAGYFMDILNRNRESANMDSMINEAMAYEDYMNAASNPMMQMGGSQTYMKMPGNMYPYSGDFNWSMKDDTNYAKAQNTQMWQDYTADKASENDTRNALGNLASTYIMGYGSKQQYLKPKKAKSEILSGPQDLPSAPLMGDIPTAQRGYVVPFSEQIQGMPYSDAMSANYRAMQNPALAKKSGKKWWESMSQMFQPKVEQQTTTPGSKTTQQPGQGTGQPSSGLTVVYGPQGWGTSRFRNYNEAYMAPQDVYASRVTKKRGVIPWNKTLTYEYWHSPTQKAQMQTQEKQDPAASNKTTTTGTTTTGTTTTGQNPTTTQGNTTPNANPSTTPTTGTNVNNNVTPGPNVVAQGQNPAKKQGGGNPNMPTKEAYEDMQPMNPLSGMVQQQRDQSNAEQEAKMQLKEPDPYFKTTNEYKVKTRDPYRADKIIFGTRAVTSALENISEQGNQQVAQEKLFAEANRRGLKAGENYRGAWEPNQGNINPYAVVPSLGDAYTTQYGGMPSYVIPYVQYGGMPYDFYQMGGQYMDNDYGYMQDGGDMEDHVGYYTDEEIQEMRRNNPGMQIDFLD